jgi:hypothetical protein
MTPSGDICGLEVAVTAVTCLALSQCEEDEKQEWMRVRNLFKRAHHNRYIRKEGEKRLWHCAWFTSYGRRRSFEPKTQLKQTKWNEP